MKTLNQWSRADLLALPVSRQNTVYDAIIIVDTGTINRDDDPVFAVIGCIGSEPLEIASTYADDISWFGPHSSLASVELEAGVIYFANPKQCLRVFTSMGATDIYTENL